MADRPTTPEFSFDPSGPDGESLFRSFGDLGHWGPSKESLEELIALVEQLREFDDDRLTVLFGSLVIENAVDALLESAFPGFQRLRENRDFTLSLRIELARALRFIPSKILGSADCIRQVRNDFVHNLAIKTFEDLRPGRLDAMRDWVLNHYRDGEATSVDKPSRIFVRLTTMTTISLRLYASMVESLMGSMYSREFHELLAQLVAAARRAGAIR